MKNNQLTGKYIMIKLTTQTEKFIDVFYQKLNFRNHKLKDLLKQVVQLLSFKIRCGHGTYSLNYGYRLLIVVDLPVGQTSVGGVNVLQNDISVVPEIVKEYVPGHFTDLKSIVKSRLFFPVLRLSGNGKKMVEQIY